MKLPKGAAQAASPSGRAGTSSQGPVAVGLSGTGSTTAQTGAGTAATARAVPPLQPALCPRKLPWVLQQVLLVPVPPRGFSWAAPSGWQGECIPLHASCTS